ncbi:MAG: efflux transporter outer membrane subunit [Zoogloeaceae bacterium]|jgi:multidrug efflux system outer membrane protein|nr:efflux transporter outer membrane subunit [Zoogloeaceae bacterium]
MRKTIILSSAILIAGCSLAPNYERPAAPVAADWPKDAASGTREVANLDWRAYFPDAQLQSLIADALEYNRDLRIAVARVAEARALYGVVRADRLPNLYLGASQTGSHVPADLSGTGTDITARRYDVNVAIVSFELDFWGRVANLSAAAKASYLATEEAERAFRLSLIADVANAWFVLLEMNERAALAQETVASAEETRKLMARLRDVGVAGDLDYLAADGAWQAAKADLANLEHQQSAAATALTLLVGKSLDDLPVAGKKLADQGVVADLAAGLPSEVLTRRPDVLSAEQNLIAANANIGAARAAFLPRISLTGAFGTASRLLSGLFTGGSDAWNFQPVLSMPLFDFGRAAANTDVAEARKVQAVAQYEKTIQQAFREVADLLSARDRLVIQLQAMEAAEKAQTQRKQIVDARYKAGISSYLEVLDAQRQLFTAQQTVVTTRRALLSTAAQLYKALGGE